jgi:hypothetical protein
VFGCFCLAFFLALAFNSFKSVFFSFLFFTNYLPFSTTFLAKYAVQRGSTVQGPFSCQCFPHAAGDEDAMRYSSRGEGAGEGGIGGSRPQYAAMEAGGAAVAAPPKKGQLKDRPAAGRRGRKSFFFLKTQTADLSTGCGSGSPLIHLYIYISPKKGFCRKSLSPQKEGGETRARSQGSNPRFNSFWFQQRATR